MNKVHLARRGLALVVLSGALGACGSETTAPNGSFEQATPARQNAATPAATLRVRAPVPNPIGTQPPCENPFSERICPVLP